MTELHISPEMRACFEADAQSILKKVQDTLPALEGESPDFSQLSSLSSDLHSLRGAAALVGGQAVAAFASDLERLLEIAASFQFGAVDQARDIFRLIQDIFPALRETLHHTLADQPAAADHDHRTARQRILQQWGEYFYSDPTADPREPQASDGIATTSSAAEIARNFLQSLGVDTVSHTDATAASNPPSEGSGTDPEREPIPRPASAAWPLLAPAEEPEPAGEAAMEYRLSDEGLPGSESSEAITPEGQKIIAAEFLRSLGLPPGTDPASSESDAEPAPAPEGFVPPDPNPAGGAGRLATPAEAKTTSSQPLLGDLEPEALADFVTEVEDHLEQLEERLAVWQQHPDDKEPAYAVYRLVHTIKGTAYTIGAVSIGRLLHDLEDILEWLVEGQSLGDFEEFVRLVREVSSMVGLLVREGASRPASPGTQAALQDLMGKIRRWKEAGSDSNTDDSPKAAALHQTEACPEEASPEDPRGFRMIRVESGRLDSLMNLVGELVISRTRLEQKLTDIAQLKKELLLSKSRLLESVTDFHENEDSALLIRSLVEIGADAGEILGRLGQFFELFSWETGLFGKITAQLQEEISRVRMVPVAGVFRRLQRAAREAAAQEGKAIDFLIQGGEARLDKAILDQIYQPLLHIVRNAVAHGIEAAGHREERGKPPAGQLCLRAHPEAHQVVLEISDDGRGLDFEAIRAEAVRRGLIKPTDTPPPETLTHLIFEPSFSTADRTSDVSGRGMGLDVVRQEILRLNGTVHVLSERDAGCTFVICLPLTLSISQAMFVQLGGETFALPLNFIDRILDPQTVGLTGSGLEEFVKVDEEVLPLINLSQVFGLPSAAAVQHPLILARVANHSKVLQVDRILHKQDVVVKPLHPWLKPCNLYAGATVAGDGRVVLIPNLQGIFESPPPISDQDAAAAQECVPPDLSHERKTASILVVDDSISVRRVLQNHLEPMGYEVTTAVHGLEALEKLRGRRFALVLTDLEMPRLSGFDLVEEMRQRESLRNIPVIILTSRDTEKHRRRASDLKVQRYLVKPCSREQLTAAVHQVLHVRQPEAA